jgi:hypothetical protein
MTKQRTSLTRGADIPANRGSVDLAPWASGTLEDGFGIPVSGS